MTQFQTMAVNQEQSSIWSTIKDLTSTNRSGQKVSYDKTHHATENVFVYIYVRSH